MKRDCIFFTLRNWALSRICATNSSPFSNILALTLVGMRFPDCIKLTHPLAFSIKFLSGIRTPVFLAAENNYLSLLNIITSCDRFDPNTKDKDGNTLLIICAQKGNIEVAKELARNPKIDLNCRDKLGRTPLHITAENKKVAFFKWLLDQDSVDVNIQDNMKRTPLHIAAMANEECVRMLLEAGQRKKLNTHIRDTNGKYASSYCRVNTLQIANEIENFELID